MPISPDYRRRLVVMVKEPRPGRVKTRLARDIGTVDAARWFRRQALSVIRRLEDPRWEMVLAVTPDRAGLASRVWPHHLPRVPQGRGDLGVRMTRLFRQLPSGPTVIVGSDIPDLSGNHVGAAFAALGAADAVLGPASDGGYWLIGLRRVAACPGDVLAGVRWSSPHALDDTRRCLAGKRIAWLDELDDVDTGADLARRRGRASTWPITGPRATSRK